MTIGSNIKMRRLELGLSQAQLAHAVGYSSRSAIAKIESGATEVPVSRLLPLARVLDTSVENLLDENAEGRAWNDSGAASRFLAGKETGANGPRTAAVVLAGGTSSRNLQNVPNQFVNVLGRPLIGYCMETLQSHPMVDDMLVVCLDGYEDILAAYARRSAVSKLRGIVSAGRTGVLSAKAGYDWLLSHGYGYGDCVVFQESTRPLVAPETITRVIRAALHDGSAVAGGPMSDYVQFYRSGPAGAERLDRDRIVELQSPDAYRIGVLRNAFRLAEDRHHTLEESTCGMLMHALGLPMNFCESERRNVKVVRQDDVAIVTALLRSRQ